MLSRADYGDLWDGHGYPARPSLPALTGSVIHRCLELLLTALQARNCGSIADPSAVEAIRELGGYSRLIESVIAEEAEILHRNPRAVDSVAAIGDQLATEVPRIRERVQMAISRAQLTSGGDGSDASADGAEGSGAVLGSFTEVELRADELRLLGRADLISTDKAGCTITDYKTGEPSDHHAEQVRLYALLWSRDGGANPGQIPARRLVVSYATHDVVLDAPSDADLETLASHIAARISATEKALTLRPPSAKPDPDTCRFCDVKHLCDDYWVSVAPTIVADSAAISGCFVDVEAEVSRQNGPRSWVLGLDGEPRSALLRMLTETPGFAVGDYVRLLGVIAGSFEEDGSQHLILTMTQFSEMFLVDRA